MLNVSSPVKIISMNFTDEYQVVESYPVFDQSKIEGLSATITAEKAKDFAERYIESLKEQTALIIKSLNDVDYSVLEFNAHKLSSGAGTFGHMYLHHACLYIEKYAMDGEIGSPFDTKEGVHLLGEKIEQSIQEIEVFLSNL